jgi:hypothetical protein
MPQGPPGDQPQVCACPGCDKIVIQRDPGSTRLYHSDECRRKARRLRHERQAARTAGPPAVAAVPGPPAADPAAAEPAIPAEPAAAQPAVLAELAAAGLSGSTGLLDSAAEDDAVSVPAEQAGTDAAGPPGDSGFWKPRDGGFWEADEDSARAGTRAPGQHRLPVSRRSRLKRSHAAAIAVTLAASAAGLGLIFSQPGARHPLASGAELRIPAPAGTTQPASSSSSPGPTPVSRAPGHAAGGTSPAARPTATSQSRPPATGSPVPSPSPSRTSPPPSPTPSRSARPARRVSPGLISFENGTDGWSPFWGNVSESRTTRVAYSGSHSLLMTTTSTYSAVGVDNGSVADLRPGDEVTFHIHSDGQNGSLDPFVQDSDYNEHFVAKSVALPSRPGWLTLTWVVPSTPSVHAIGLQVADPGSSQITLAIDALSWAGS